MRVLKLFLCLCVIFMISAGLVLAQAQPPAEQKSAEAEQKKAEEPPVMTLGALMYMNWHIGLTESTDSSAADRKNTFEFERLYLDLKYKIDDVWSARITTDVENKQTLEDVEYDKTNTDEKVVSATPRSKYSLYIKHGYVQAKKKLDPVDFQLRAGMIDTPISGFVDTIGDQRWIMENMIMMSKYMLFTESGAYTLDSTADMGVQLQAGYQKLVTAVAGLTNGEGYKNTDESAAGDRSRGKAYYGRLTIMPIENFYINGYYKLEGTNTDVSKNQKGYYGGGIAWAADMLKAGANYILPYERIDGVKIADNSGDEYKMSIIDAWLSMNFETLVGVPVIVMARYGLADNGLENGMTTFIGGGAGYVFNKYCRVIAWYQQLDNEANDADGEPNPEKQFAIKAEVKI